MTTLYTRTVVFDDSKMTSFDENDLTPWHKEAREARAAARSAWLSGEDGSALDQIAKEATKCAVKQEWGRKVAVDDNVGLMLTNAPGDPEQLDVYKVTRSPRPDMRKIARVSAGWSNDALRSLLQERATT